MNALNSLLTAVGWVVGIGGTIGAVAFALMRFFGEKWLSAKFDERLASYKHAQQKELEELKFKINSLMDRTTKLHQKEFDVLPEAWGKLSDAYGGVTSTTSFLQQYPDLDRMNAVQLDDFLNDCPLRNWQKDEIKSAAKKSDQYVKAIDWYKIIKCREACRESHLYLVKNGIFIPEPLKGSFLELNKLVFESLVEHELNVQGNLRGKDRVDESLKKLRQTGEKMLKELERIVEDRLWNSQRL